MGRLWCEGFKTVTVPTSVVPKRLTLVIPYYDNRAFFGAQIAHWKGFPDVLRFLLSVIVVDDGSPTYPARDVARRLAPIPFLRLFRIDVDLRWNWLAARNIGFHHADEGWVLVTDMDHVVPVETLSAVMFGQHDPSIVYAFRRREHTGVEVNPHSASFLMTREMFWKIGGYDEKLSGHYGTDGEYRRRLAQHAPIQILRQSLIRHEYQGDSSTQTYLRKQPMDAEVKRIVARRGKGWKPRVLSFPYHEETLASAAA